MPMTSTQPTAARAFVPKDADLADPAAILPLYDDLDARPITSAAQLEQWLRDYSELVAAVDEFGSRLYIEKSCHTDDKEIERRFLSFVETVEPAVKPRDFRLKQRYLANEFRPQLLGPRYAMLNRAWEADAKLFREENVPLETEMVKLVNEYDKVCGAMLVEFKGKTYTPQQMARFLEEPDRPTREAAWKANTERRMRDREQIDQLFDQLRPLRQTIARNAGFDDARAYYFAAKHRFDYGPDECFAFADAVEKTCVPLMKQLEAERKAELKIDVLRPWDLSVDPQNRAPLRPFDPADIDGFVSTTKRVFGRIDPRLADDFEQLRAHGNLDLDSRPGKQPGGYQSSLLESGQPFVFMNAAGLHRDVETLLHEGGHAFHMQWASKGEPLVFLQHAPMEFCEVASMGMELLATDHLDEFYGDKSEFGRARRDQMEGVVRTLPWIATIDLFQHWIYTHPDHTRVERTAHWLALLDRFGGSADWSGFGEERAALWQRQLHLFHVPFYYIEYGIAQLGALQLWLRAKGDPKDALAQYRAALALGGTRPLPELFATAGLKFDFGAKTVGPLMSAVKEELAA